MALPLVVPLLAGAAFLALALSDDKKGGGGGGPAPFPGGGGGGGDDWFTVSPTGALMLKPERQPQVYATLSSQFIAGPVPPGTYGPSDAVQYNTSPGASAVLAWISNETRAKGNIVIMSTTMPYLASVPKGQELQWCQPSMRKWAVLAAPESLSMPAGGATQPGTYNVPGIGPVTIPGMGGQQQQPGQQPGQQQQQPGGMPQPGQTIQTPFGPVTVPAIPGVNAPQQQPGQPPPQQQPGPTTPAPANPGGASPPPAGTPINTPWGPMTVPSIPGVNAPATPTGPSTAGPWPADHMFTVRAGDMPSKMAQWYTGDFTQAEALRSLNGLVSHGSGSGVYYTPWYPGQQLKLPMNWNVAKGPPPLGSSSTPSTSSSSTEPSDWQKAQQAAYQSPTPYEVGTGYPTSGNTRTYAYRDLGGGYTAGVPSDLTYGGWR